MLEKTVHQVEKYMPIEIAFKKGSSATVAPKIRSSSHRLRGSRHYSIVQPTGAFASVARNEKMGNGPTLSGVQGLRLPMYPSKSKKFANTLWKAMSALICPVLLLLVLPTALRAENVADSATIVLPETYTIVSTDTISVLVEPRCSVVSVLPTVRLWPDRVDTLATLYDSPFRTVWRTRGIPDQDQFYLQFGYILHLPSGDTIVSPPSPHRWVLLRNPKSSGKRYACRHVPPGREIEIDGELSEWNRYKTFDMGAEHEVRCTWTSAAFYVGARILDDSPSPKDRVELMFDLKKSESVFLDIDHRVYSFAPRSRSFVWAIEQTDSGGRAVDSVIIRTEEEMEWRALTMPDGYVLEVRIPFPIISELEFPPKRLGFDVAVTDWNSGRETSVTWSGTEPSARHMPAAWGTVTLHQPMFPLKLTLVSLLGILAVIGIVVALVTLRRMRRDRMARKAALRPKSPIVQETIRLIDEHSVDPHFSAQTVATQLSVAAEELNDRLAHEMNADFDRLLTAARVARAKQLLREDTPELSRVPTLCGYTDEKRFENDFTTIVGASPEEFRRIRLEERAEEEREEDGDG